VDRKLLPVTEPLNNKFKETETPNDEEMNTTLTPQHHDQNRRKGGKGGKREGQSPKPQQRGETKPEVKLAPRSQRIRAPMLFTMATNTYVQIGMN